MVNSERIYIILCILFSVIIVIGNLTYQKFVSLAIFPFHSFELGVGAILYPLTFLITDLITEFYGKEKAKFCVRCAILMNILVVIIVSFMDMLPATSWSKIDNVSFHNMFGFYSVSFAGSIIACYISQIVDVSIYLWIRKITNGKFLWLRSNGSTAISLFIDTFIVITFLSLFGVLPAERLWILIANSYVFKLFFTISSTPLFYLCVLGIRMLIRKDSIQ